MNIQIGPHNVPLQMGDNVDERKANDAYNAGIPVGAIIDVPGGQVRYTGSTQYERLTADGRVTDTMTITDQQHSTMTALYAYRTASKGVYCG